MSGGLESGGNHGARCQLRQNSFLGLCSKDGIWGQCNDIGAQIAHFFFYRMDIRVGQCVSQASQRQSPSAKLFCFIAPPFPPFPQPPKPPVSHTFHISQVYWPWKRLITCHMILIRHSLFKYLQDSCVRFYPNSRILSSFVCFERSTLRDKWEQLRIYTFKWGHVYMNDASIYDPCSLTLIYVSVIHNIMQE